MNNLRSSMLALALAIGGISATAVAEDAVAEDGAPPVNDGSAGSPGGTSLASMVAKGDAAAKRAATMSDKILGLLDQARRDGDVIMVTCLNAVLNQVNSAKGSLASRADALKAAVDRGDEQRAKHEYTVINVMAQKMDDLDKEASSCTGQDVYEPGSAQVVTDIDPSQVPSSSVDPTQADAPPSLPPAVSLPPPASGVI